MVGELRAGALAAVMLEAIARAAADVSSALERLGGTAAFEWKIDGARVQLPVHAYFFDCLRLGQQTLVDRPARARFAALAQAVPVEQRVPRLVTSDALEAQRFYEQALAAGHEGVMAKALDAPYEAGNRGASWLKIKRTHTLDLVVLAAEWGHGRRSGWLSNLHLGARDALTVYVRPELVVEVAFNDIQASPQYPGALALRFARVKRYRTDKTAEQADTLTSVRMLYEAQSGAL